MSAITITLNGIDNATGAIEGAAGALSGMGEIAGGVLSAGLGLASSGLGVMTDFMGDAFSAALENEQAQSSLAQVIKATGGAAGITAEEANAMATQFADLAGGSDDAIIAIETIGLRAGTVAEADFPRFIQASLDLGTVMGSTEAAATLLARAGDDIGASIGKAEKAGILFTDQQKAEMIAMQDAGDTAGAVDLFMQQLALTTGGAAAAAAETFTGKWELMKGKFGEVAESIGTAILPLMTQLFDNVIAPAIPVIEQMANFMVAAFEMFVSGNATAGVENLMGILETFFGVIGINMPDQVAFFRSLWAIWDELPAKMATAQAAFQPLVDAVGSVLAAFIDSMPMIQASVQGMVDFVINLFNTFSPTIIANVTDTLNTIAAFWTAHGDEVMAVVSFLFNTIATVIGGALTLVSGLISTNVTIFTGVWAAGSALLEGDTEGAWAAISTMVTSATATIKSTITSFMNGVLSLVGTDLATFTATWQTNWDMAKTIVSTIWTNISTTVTTTISSMIAGILLLFNTAVSNIQLAFNIDWIALGTSIITGIQSGISNAVGGLVNSAVQAANDAFNAAADALLSHSPSMLFAELGENTQKGMALGIDSASIVAVEAARNAALAVGQIATETSAMMGAEAGEAFVDPYWAAMQQTQAEHDAASAAAALVDPYWAAMQETQAQHDAASAAAARQTMLPPMLPPTTGGYTRQPILPPMLPPTTGGYTSRPMPTIPTRAPVSGGACPPITINMYLTGTIAQIQKEIQNTVVKAINESNRKMGLAVQSTARMGARLP